MRKAVFPIIVLSFIGFIVAPLVLASSEISVKPDVIIQGDPIMVVIQSDSSPSQLLLGNTNIPIFSFQGKWQALIGIDLLKKPGTYQLKAKLNNGEIIIKDITIGERPRIEEPLGIPEKLGGNTTSSQNNLVSDLSKENQSLANTKTGTKAFWAKAFKSPLKNIIVTDSYGYIRQTGAYDITHKGVDLRASEGTKVMAMNRGVVRIARTYRIYGKTIVIDHGLGLKTLYMHLSKIYVNEGELVLPSQVIGLSGQTGYAQEPHLHISVKINNISIDPIQFLNLFN